MKRLSCLYALLIGLLIFSSHIVAAKSDTKNLPTSLPEIHLLVDVSGSMKRTDPQNLRAKAIKMFIYLMKQKALMGIDTFAAEAQPVIQVHLIDNDFANTFLHDEGKITSGGSWTDIEQALNSTLKTWNNQNKVIVLLTDGQIDLNSQDLSSASRERVLHETIKNLQDAKIRVFTIGFSKDADADLLNKIAERTNGIAQEIDTSQDIDTTLYKIFTAIVPVNGVPIEQNQNATRTIKVDKSIQQMTLIFKKNPQITDLYLSSPKGDKKAINELIQKEGTSENYVFVALNKPQNGVWTLFGPKQDIERAIILTDVKLISSFTSGVYFAQEELIFNAHIEANGTIVDAPLIMDNLHMQLKLQGAKERDYEIPYVGKGQFSKTLTLDNPEGKYNLTLSLKSPYLSRELQFVIDLQPVPFKQKVISYGTSTLELTHPDLIKSDSVQIKVLSGDKNENIDSVKDGLIWKVNFTKLCNAGGATPLAFNIVAKTTSDRNVSFHLPIVFADLCPSLNSTVEPLTTSSVKTTVTPSNNEPKPVGTQPQKSTPESKEAEKQQFKINYKIFTYVIIILLLLIVFFGFGLAVGIAYAKKIKRIKIELTSENKND